MTLLGNAVQTGELRRSRGFACWHLSPHTKLLAASVNGCIQYRLIVKDPAGFLGIDDLFNENDEVRDAFRTAGILGADGRVKRKHTCDVCKRRDFWGKGWRSYYGPPKSDGTPMGVVCSERCEDKLLARWEHGDMDTYGATP